MTVSRGLRSAVPLVAVLTLAWTSLIAGPVASSAPAAPRTRPSAAAPRDRLERDSYGPALLPRRSRDASTPRAYASAPTSRVSRSTTVTTGSVRTYPVPYCCAEQEVEAAGGLIVLADDGEHGHVLRLDPDTGHVEAELYLPAPPAGNDESGQFNQDTPKMVVARDSVWFASYFENLVYRLDPVTLAIRARIRTGRTPSSLAYGGGSLWTTLNNSRSIARIDPRRDRVAAQIRLGRQRDLADQPYSVVWSGTGLLVTLPGSGRVAHLSARGRVLRYDHVGKDLSSPSINKLVPVPGGYWIDATDDGTGYFRWSDRSRSITATFRTPASVGMAYADGAVYTGGAHCDASFTCTGGLVEKHDATTGALLGEREIPGDTAVKPFVVLGSLWTLDFDSHSLQRSPLF